MTIILAQLGSLFLAYLLWVSARGLLRKEQDAPPSGAMLAVMAATTIGTPVYSLFLTGPADVVFIRVLAAVGWPCFVVVCWWIVSHVARRRCFLLPPWRSFLFQLGGIMVLPTLVLALNVYFRRKLATNDYMTPSALVGLWTIARLAIALCAGLILAGCWIPCDKKQAVAAQEPAPRPNDADSRGKDRGDGGAGGGSSDGKGVDGRAR